MSPAYRVDSLASKHACRPPPIALERLRESLKPSPHPGKVFSVFICEERSKHTLFRAD